MIINANFIGIYNIELLLEVSVACQYDKIKTY